MGKVLAIVILLLATIISCNNPYKAGNLVSLSYSINTNLRTSIIHTYCDTLVTIYGYGVPNKWKMKAKMVEFDSTNNIRIYFKNKPEEMYLISFGGMLVLEDVYNTNIRDDGGYISRRELITKEEEIRIKTRFKTEILDKVEAMAKRNGVPDTLIYKNQ